MVAVRNLHLFSNDSHPNSMNKGRDGVIKGLCKIIFAAFFCMMDILLVFATIPRHQIGQQ